jgi:S1-C subfamily serine protease
MYSLSLKPMSFSRSGFGLLLGTFLIAGATQRAAAANDLRGLERMSRSVVKIYVAKQRPMYETPWATYPPGGGTGSGFLVKGNRLLTNAHVVSDARFIEVQHDGDPRRFQARVKFTGLDCDMAVLDVEDTAFFDGPPLEIAASIPPLNADVAVLGYPAGGDRLSLTKGVVSRIDYSGYSHSGVDQHLVMQVDAAINPGNSGGPILYRGKVVGLAFQGMVQADNIGYGIPVPVMEHFLKDIEDGTYDGFPELGAFHMDTRSVPLRRSLGLPGTGGGCVVTYVDPFGAAYGLLKPGDVLLSVQDHPVASDGSITLDNRALVFSELIERMQWGESVKFGIWRDRTRSDIVIRMANQPDPFAFRNIYDAWPDYRVFAGLVFSPLTREYLKTLGRNVSSANEQQLQHVLRYAKIDDLWRDRTEFVVLIRRLPHPINTYLDAFQNGIVVSVNGEPAPSLAALGKALEKPSNGFHVIRFMSMDQPMVLEESMVEAADREIRLNYRLPPPNHAARK